MRSHTRAGNAASTVCCATQRGSIAAVRRETRGGGRRGPRRKRDAADLFDHCGFRTYLTLLTECRATPFDGEIAAFRLVPCAALLLSPTRARRLQPPLWPGRRGRCLPPVGVSRRAVTRGAVWACLCVRPSPISFCPPHPCAPEHIFIFPEGSCQNRFYGVLQRPHSLLVWQLTTLPAVPPPMGPTSRRAIDLRSESLGPALATRKRRRRKKHPGESFER